MHNNNKNKRVFVAMSGGVDSSVTAALLKKQGYAVVGIHIKMWSPHPSRFQRDGAGQADLFSSVCRQQYQDRLDAMRVAAVLDIPFQTWDLTGEYKEWVVEYMIREYRAGRTPNPDVMCNREIKFGVFLKKALAAGADFIATGHYVRLSPKFSIFNDQFSKKIKSAENLLKIKNFKLKIARDLNKDQSYFLWTLTQNQLKHCLFPLGEYIKPEVRKLAKKFKLPTAEKKDSQGICFIGEINLREFLKKYIKPKPGKIVTTGGKVVGEHEGLPFYTIGQRHGINIGGGIPYYTVSKDFKKNRLIVGLGPYDQKLFSSKLRVADFSWISGKKPKLSLKCRARIRYRQPLENCIIKPGGLVEFAKPQRALTPGQSIVFYQGDEMLGGGIIS